MLERFKDQRGQYEPLNLLVYVIVLIVLIVLVFAVLDRDFQGQVNLKHFENPDHPGWTYCGLNMTRVVAGASRYCSKCSEAERRRAR
jgi:hypothetical protein